MGGGVGPETLITRAFPFGLLTFSNRAYFTSESLHLKVLAGHEPLPRPAGPHCPDGAPHPPSFQSGKFPAVCSVFLFWAVGKVLPLVGARMHCSNSIS